MSGIVERLEEKLCREKPAINKLFRRRILLPRLALVASLAAGVFAGAYAALWQYKKFDNELTAAREDNARLSRRDERRSRELRNALQQNENLLRIASNSVKYIDLLIEPLPSDERISMTKISQGLAEKGYGRPLYPPEVFRILIDYHEKRLPETLRSIVARFNEEWLGLELRREGDKLSCLFGPYTKPGESFPSAYVGREFDAPCVPYNDAKPGHGTMTNAESLQPDLIKFLFSREYKDLPKEMKPIYIWIPMEGTTAQVGYLTNDNGITIGPNGNGWRLRGAVELPVPTETVKYIDGNVILQFGDDTFRMPMQKASDIYKKIDADEKQAGRKFTPAERKQYFARELNGAK